MANSKHVALTVVLLFCQQTASAAEDVEPRLQRIKQEAVLVEEHSEKLENRNENDLKGEPEISAADPEVCEFSMVISIFLHGI